MAEIEHFVDPQDKDHPKFSTVADLKVPLLSSKCQLEEQGRVERGLTIGEAVKSGLIANETLGYFMGRTYLFFKTCGINDEGMRFR